MKDTKEERLSIGMAALNAIGHRLSIMLETYALSVIGDLAEEEHLKMLITLDKFSKLLIPVILILIFKLNKKS